MCVNTNSTLECFTCIYTSVVYAWGIDCLYGDPVYHL